MHIVVESRDPEGLEHRELAERRLKFVLRRLAWLVPRARVQLADINGPRGGVDKQCRVEIKTDTRGAVVVTALARDWPSAIDSALARAGRAVLRTLRRGQQMPGRAAPKRRALLAAAA
jgi:hypothetical protein